jgi:hypothetical protein
MPANMKFDTFQIKIILNALWGRLNYFEDKIQVLGQLNEEDIWEEKEIDKLIKIFKSARDDI